MHTTHSEYNDSSISYNHSCFHNLKMSGIEPLTHDGYELIFLKNGDITYLIEGKSYRVKKNSLILTRPGKRHTVLFNSPDVYDRYDIILDENIIASSLAESIPENIDVLKIGEQRQMCELFSKLDYYYKYFRGEDYKRLLTNLTNEIFSNIAIIANHNKELIPTSGYSENPVITAAIEYIENNIASDLSLNTLANELFISKSYLHQLFMEHLKISPQRYISGKRLILIQKEIRRGIKPTEAYLKYGYSDYSTFYRAYRKYFGYPPSEGTRHDAILQVDISVSQGAGHIINTATPF